MHVYRNLTVYPERVLRYWDDTGQRRIVTAFDIRTAVINNAAECVSTFHIHHMLRVNDAEFTWLDKQWEAHEI
ncbi:Hypothetical predicted protein [Scomber scombrus]|uniref:Uncharacterized protein n=1 Tax=Scomber scombrus TaxID=13677 RepID=A0AAV1MTA4_SCOSC